VTDLGGSGQSERMDLGFGGEVAQLYQTYRRGYPDAVVDAIVDECDLTSDDVAVDLGCGTGQLTLGLAQRLRAVVGVDPEADMLVLARTTSADQGVRNVAWLLGSDVDLPAIEAVLGPSTVGVVTAATALHWMRDDEVFRASARLIRPGGGFAVVTNGKPLWQLDIPWSRALRGAIEAWTGQTATAGCGSDEAAQDRYRANLSRAGLSVSERVIEYAADLDLDHVVGGVLSAFPLQSLPTGADRAQFADSVRQALGGGPFTEPVRVGLLFGIRT
jgi:ubiquinone/menaquinone biosynthesis C-methylase UbiE